MLLNDFPEISTSKSQIFNFSFLIQRIHYYISYLLYFFKSNYFKIRTYPIINPFFLQHNHKSYPISKTINKDLRILISSVSNHYPFLITLDTFPDRYSFWLEHHARGIKMLHDIIHSLIQHILSQA